MKYSALMTVVLVFGLVVFSGCATTQTWPDHERSAEDKMVAIQEKIGEGLKTGALTPDQSESFLTKLKGIRTDYTELRGKDVTRREWKKIHVRLDLLGEEINSALTRNAKIEYTGSGDRILNLQRRIDDARVSERLPQAEGEELQTRLDLIRGDYLRMTEDGRNATNEERTDISRRLDSLATDLNRYR